MTEDGFTLSGLTMSLAAGLAVVLTALAFVDMSRGVPPGRPPPAPPGRRALDQVARELRARVCLDPGGAAIVNGQEDSVTFYSFQGDPSRAFVPERHTITWNGGTHELVDYAFVGIGAAPGTTFPGSPTSTTTLATGVTPVGNTPIFAYYAWRAGGREGPNVRLAAPLSDVDAQRAVRIVVRFAAARSVRGSKAREHRREFSAEVVERTEDASAAGTPGVPNCS